MRSEKRLELYEKWLKQKQYKDAELKRRKEAWTIASRKAYKEHIEYNSIFSSHKNKMEAYKKELERRAFITRTNNSEKQYA